MRKCYMINTPFIFNAVWFVIKGLLAARYVPFLLFAPNFCYDMKEIVSVYQVFTSSTLHVLLFSDFPVSFLSLFPPRRWLAAGRWPRCQCVGRVIWTNYCRKSISTIFLVSVCAGATCFS